MIDFTAVRKMERTVAELGTTFTKEDLRVATQAMVDRMLAEIADCVDADVSFVPDDPAAHDAFAASESELRLPWTLGHVVAHATATAEEAAAIAAELARGVPPRGGRSRREVPWHTVTTVEQCRQRLRESLRMRVASLDMWPDEPDLRNSYVPREGAAPINATTRFLNGLKHDDDHVFQIAEIVRQATAARKQTQAHRRPARGDAGGAPV
ncbi:MAG: DinB family protein [Chloroflexota bacterium]|nr:DinB family protein [Chloroflexota bacterium]